VRSIRSSGNPDAPVPELRGSRLAQIYAYRMFSHSDDEGQPAHAEWRAPGGEKVAKAVCTPKPHWEDAARSHRGSKRG